MGGSPAPRLEALLVLRQPVRFFDLTPAADDTRTVAGMYADDAASAVRGPGQIQIGRHSNVGGGSGRTRRHRRIIVQWHSHPAGPAADGTPSEGRRRRSVPGESRGPSLLLLPLKLSALSSRSRNLSQRSFGTG